MYRVLLRTVAVPLPARHGSNSGETEPQFFSYRLKKQAVKERRVFKSPLDNKWSLKP
jgi:hypothetical protein